MWPAGPEPMMVALVTEEGFSAAAPPFTSMGAMSAVTGKDEGRGGEEGRESATRPSRFCAGPDYA